MSWALRDGLNFSGQLKAGQWPRKWEQLGKKTPGGGCFRLGLLRSSECKVEGFYLEVTLKGKIVNVG